MKEFSFGISDEIRSQVQDMTKVKIPHESEVVAKAAQKSLESKSFQPSAESLIIGTYIDQCIEIREQLLVYFYWCHNKFKKRKDKGYYSLNIIKDQLGFTASQMNDFLSNYSFKHDTVCPSCSTVIEVDFIDLKLPRYSKSNVCLHCNHLMENYISKKCNCEKCQVLVQTVEHEFQLLRINIEKYAETLSNDDELENSNQKHFPEHQQKWFAENFEGTLSKTERKVISFHPKTIDDIKGITFDSEYHRVIGNLVKKKAIFEKEELRDVADIVQNFLNTIYFFVRKDSYWSHKSAAELILENCRVNQLSIGTERNNVGKLIVNFDPLSLEVENSEQVKNWQVIYTQHHSFSSPIREHIYKPEYALNPYFFETEQLDIPAVEDEEVIKCLFKSDIELTKYEYLTQKYTDVNVMVNVPLSCVIEMNYLKPFYQGKEFQIIKYCIVDYVLYSKRGFPIMIIELQRGKHHDEPDRIYRDKLKQSAIKKSGITFKEIY